MDNTLIVIALGLVALYFITKEGMNSYKQRVSHPKQVGSVGSVGQYKERSHMRNWWRKPHHG